MTDEEKKAVRELKHYCNLTQYWKNVEYTKYEFDDYIKTVLNLIEKQSKEIEELKKPKYIIDMKTNKITKLTNDFISKNKIKAKIKELEKEQHKNQKELQKAIDLLWSAEIEKQRNKIIVNLEIRNILEKFLKEKD